MFKILSSICLEAVPRHMIQTSPGRVLVRFDQEQDQDIRDPFARCESFHTSFYGSVDQIPLRYECFRLIEMRCYEGEDGMCAAKREREIFDR